MKYFLSILTTLLIFNYSQAQIKLGVKLSPQLNFTREGSKNIESSQVPASLSYGLMMDYYLGENYGICTEITVHQLRAVFKPNNTSVVENNSLFAVNNLTYKQQYLSIPLFLKMRTNEIGYWRYFAEFGYSVNFSMRSIMDVDATGKSFENVNVNNPDPSDNFMLVNNQTPGSSINYKTNFFRTSLILGAGIQYKIFGNTLLNTGIRYENSNTDITSTNNWNASVRSLMLNVGILF
ncbi:MAG: PorT family protein [Bacteroidia bacterium]|jgi:opacity protein-like surface antigen|nr:PorT family protein [Bacteroidia bacterium]